MNGFLSLLFLAVGFSYATYASALSSKHYTSEQFHQDLETYWPSARWIIPALTTMDLQQRSAAVNELCALLSDSQRRWSYVTHDAQAYNQKEWQIFFIEECRAYTAYFKQITPGSPAGTKCLAQFYAFYFSLAAHLFVCLVQTAYQERYDTHRFRLVSNQAQACLQELASIAQTLTATAYDSDAALHITRYRELLALLLAEKREWDVLEI